MYGSFRAEVSLFWNKWKVREIAIVKFNLLGTVIAAPILMYRKEVETKCKLSCNVCIDMSLILCLNADGTPVAVVGRSQSAKAHIPVALTDGTIVLYKNVNTFSIFNPEVWLLLIILYTCRVWVLRVHWPWHRNVQKYLLLCVWKLMDLQWWQPDMRMESWACGEVKIGKYNSLLVYIASFDP